MEKSYKKMRNALGVLGLSLPLTLIIGGMVIHGVGIQETISDYYYTGMRAWFVGINFAIGIFFLAYVGPENKPGHKPYISDHVAGNIAGACALGLVLFPTTSCCEPSLLDRIVGILHLIFALVFLLMTAYFSLALFTKTDPDRLPTSRKYIRNRIYRVCGTVILLAIGLITLFFIFNVLQSWVFWLETAAVVAFGFSWIIKSERLLAADS